MEKYRSALYRYSTGQGFSVNIDVPEVARDVAAYKMLPLQAQSIKQRAAVDVKREADRLSMQAEEAKRQLLTLGYDPVAGKRYRNLRSRVDALLYLTSRYPVRLIKVSDLDLFYRYHKDSSPQLDALIQKVIKYNKGGPLRSRNDLSGFGGWSTSETLTYAGIAVVIYFLLQGMI